jgi:hypothetical protein
LEKEKSKMLPVKDNKLFVKESWFGGEGGARAVCHDVWIVNFEEGGHIRDVTVKGSTFVPIQRLDNHRYFLCKDKKQCISIHNRGREYFGHIYSYPNGERPFATFEVVDE